MALVYEGAIYVVTGENDVFAVDVDNAVACCAGTITAAVGASGTPKMSFRDVYSLEALHDSASFIAKDVLR